MIYSARILNLGIPSPTGVDLPDESEFIAYVPTTDLLDFWRASTGIGVADGANVPSWTALNGSTALQPVTASQPVFDEDGMASGFPSVKATATGKYLISNLEAQAIGGVLCIGFRTPSAYSGNQMVVGSRSGAGGMVGIGYNTAGRLGAVFADLTFDDLIAAGSMPTNISGIATLVWDGTTVTLRRNGIVVASGTYSGGPGDAPLGFLARNMAETGAFDLQSTAGLGAVALYDAYKDGADLGEIEAAVAASIGFAL